MTDFRNLDYKAEQTLDGVVIECAEPIGITTALSFVFEAMNRSGLPERFGVASRWKMTQLILAAPGGSEAVSVKLTVCPYEMAGDDDVAEPSVCVEVG